MSRTTTTPRRTAQAHHLRDLIGKTVTVKLFTDPLPGDLQPTHDPRHVRVRVTDCAQPYGSARLQIEPIAGTGTAWISADKLIAWPEPQPPTDPAAVVTVVNLATGTESVYTGLTPAEAVNAAYESARGNTDYHDTLYMVETSTNSSFVHRGDFAALTRQLNRRATDKEPTT